jgi:hypothetical protein
MECGTLVEKLILNVEGAMEFLTEFSLLTHPFHFLIGLN